MSQVEPEHGVLFHAADNAGPLIGTNWKMTLTPAQTRSYLETLRALAGDIDDCQMFVLPPYPAIAVAAAVLEGSSIAWGAQDVHPVDSGPHTGDVSAPMLADLGCTYVAVGHFERRRDYGETDALIAAKAAAAQRWGMVAVLCIGEVEPTSHARAIEFVASQLDAAADLAPEGLVIAYEPGWAIGEDGTPAEVDWLRDMRRGIEEILRGTFPDVKVPVITGGNVDVQATGWLLTEAGFDGVFVGRNALDPRSFAEIAHAARQTAKMPTRAENAN